MPYLKNHDIPYISEIFNVVLLCIYAFTLYIVALGNEGSLYEEMNWVLKNKLLNSQ